jgi:hemerythrin-like metal-binding protein
MAFIQWQDHMLTGDPKIDREHREILVLINRLGEAIAEERWQNARIVGLRLFLEVCTHFADEEELMAAHAYPGLEIHQLLHARAEKQMARLDTVLSWTELHPGEVTAAYGEFIAQFDGDFFQADLHFVAFLAERRQR